MKIVRIPDIRDDLRWWNTSGHENPGGFGKGLSGVTNRADSPLVRPKEQATMKPGQLQVAGWLRLAMSVVAGFSFIGNEAAWWMIGVSCGLWC